MTLLARFFRVLFRTGATERMEAKQHLLLRKRAPGRSGTPGGRPGHSQGVVMISRLRPKQVKKDILNECFCCCVVFHLRQSSSSNPLF